MARNVKNVKVKRCKMQATKETAILYLKRLVEKYKPWLLVKSSQVRSRKHVASRLTMYPQWRLP